VKEVAGQIQTMEQELEAADEAGKIMTEKKRDQILNVLDPEYAAQTKALRAAAEADAAAEKGARDLVETSSRLLGARPELDYGSEITDTPAPAESPPPSAPASASAQLATQRATRQSTTPEGKLWTAEKTVVLDEARKLAVQLGMDDQAIIKAVENNDQKSLDAIFEEVQRRELNNPLLPYYPPDGGEGAFVSWGNTKVKGKNKLDMLRAAVEDTSIPRTRSLSGTPPSGNNVQLIVPFKEKK